MEINLNTAARGTPPYRRGRTPWKELIPPPQCGDARGNLIALWETSQLADPFAAKLTLTPAALSIVTEIVTTLILNRIAQVSNWERLVASS